MASGTIEHQNSIVDWTPVVPRSTYSDLNENKVYKSGNIVVCKCYFTIVTSNSSNDYLEYTSFPTFGKTIKFGFGFWFDNNADQSGVLTAGANNNAWFQFNGSNVSLSSRVGHAILINFIYTLI